MEPISLALTSLLSSGFALIGNKLIEKAPDWVADTLLDTHLKPLKDRYEGLALKRYNEKNADKVLLKAVQTAMAAANIKETGESKLEDWYVETGLKALEADAAAGVRLILARSVVNFTEKDADPPLDLVDSLRWPPARLSDLASLLYHLRGNLAGHPEYGPLISFANQEDQRRQFTQLLETHTALLGLAVPIQSGGKGIQVAIDEPAITGEQAEALSLAYHQQLAAGLEKQSYRGITQTSNMVQLRLADIYTSLSFLPIRDQSEHRELLEKELHMDSEARQREVEKQVDRRIDNALAENQRLIVLGLPGSGKTTLLRFTTLMLARGFSATRLGLDAPYVPVLVRALDFAQALKKEPDLALDNYLFTYIEKQFSSYKYLGRLLRYQLDQGECLVMVDGLDEIGGTEVASREEVALAVQTFADRWCDATGNRIIVTSRTEGYWDHPLAGFAHVQLSALSFPDEDYLAYSPTHITLPDRIPNITPISE